MREHQALREEIIALASRRLSVEGPLPEGDLSELLDSVQRLTLVIAIEDHYKICFEPEDDEGIISLDDVVRLVAARLEER